MQSEDLQQLRSLGYRDNEIMEIFPTVVENIFTNHFNHMAGTEVDFPKAAALWAA